MSDVVDSVKFHSITDDTYKKREAASIVDRNECQAKSVAENNVQQD